jgi:glutamate transport system substrate-binding protein
MSITARPSTSSTRRGAAAAVALAAAVTLVSACSGSSTSPAAVPGANSSNAAAKAKGESTIDQLIAAEQPADSSLMPPGSTAAAIKSRGKLIVGGTQTGALFSLLDPTTGKVSGFDAAMSQLLAKYIIGKPETDLKIVTAATREALLKNHSVDAVFATYTITPERAKVINFAGPYFLDGLAIEVRKGTGSGISSLKDLAGKTVVTQSGSTAANAIKAEAPSAHIQLFDTNLQCLQALKQGRADAYVLDQGVLAGNAMNNPDVEVLPGTFTKEPYGIGLPLDQPDFKAFVNDWLKKIAADGTWAKVWKATIGTEVPGPAPAPPTIG